jgi:hypothetical protein
MENNKSVTAVEWLQEQLIKKTMLPIEAIKQSKQIEKEQIKNAYNQGSEAGYELAKNDDFHEGIKMKEAEQYYNETFKSE